MIFKKMNENYEIYIGYGSEMGNSQAIAEGLHHTLEDDNISTTVSPLNSLINIIKNEAKNIILLIICSTTGNGDPPDNARKFCKVLREYKTLIRKQKSDEKKQLNHILYSILGMGDTNYTYFCKIPIFIDECLKLLNAQTFHPIALADDAVGSENVVEPWKDSIRNELINFSHNNNILLSPSKKSPNKKSPVLNSSNSSFNNNISSTITPFVLNEKLPSNISNILNFNDLLKFYDIEDEYQNTIKTINEIKLPSVRKIKIKIKIPSRNINIQETNPTGLPPPSSSSSSSSLSTSSSSGNDENNLFDNIDELNELKNQQNRKYGINDPFPSHVKSAVYLTKNDILNELKEDDYINIENNYEGKKVIRLDLCLNRNDQEHFIYGPGDSIGIRCPNPSNVINFIINRIKFNNSDLSEWIDIPIKIRHYPIKNATPFFSTPRLILTNLLDLQIPSNIIIILRNFAEFCDDENEKNILKFLSSKSKLGIFLREQFIIKQKLNLAELLELFPSCHPTFESLLAFLPALAPRYYSIASSPLRDSKVISIAFSVVSYQISLKYNDINKLNDNNNIINNNNNNNNNNNKRHLINRFGICTKWLEEILQPYLKINNDNINLSSFSNISKESETGSSLTISTSTNFLTDLSNNYRSPVFESLSPSLPSIILPIFLREIKEFDLPANRKWPLILIGPGTGVAPFIGFLEDLCLQKREQDREKDCVCDGLWRNFDLDLEDEDDTFDDFQINEKDEGDVWLFFGCQYKEYDWIYKNEMLNFLNNGILTKLNLSFSRETNEKYYVQDKLLEEGEKVCNLIMNDGAYIFVCGDGNKMAKDVKAAIKNILMKYGNFKNYMNNIDDNVNNNDDRNNQDNTEELNLDEKVDIYINELKLRGRYVQDVWM